MFFLLRESLLRQGEALGLGLISVSGGQESCSKSKNQRWGGGRLRLLRTPWPDGERGREVLGGSHPPQPFAERPTEEPPTPLPQKGCNARG